jgi:NAD(P)-dependent dehydrogenase (short-subunit alcohol dehydrogenase family)
VTSKIGLIVGAGGVLGDALAREFVSNRYTVIGMRREDSPDDCDVSKNAGIRIVRCDLQDPEDTQRRTAQIIVEHGRVDVLICNAAHLIIAPLAELALSDFESAWRTSVGSALGSIQSALPTMIKQGGGVIIFTGATASLRGGARFAAFASAKFALRGLAQSLAREYQAQGIHVAHVVIDGLLRGSHSQARFGAVDDRCIAPDHVAKTYRWLAEQEASSWTHELDIRPSGETF